MRISYLGMGICKKVITLITVPVYLFVISLLLACANPQPPRYKETEHTSLAILPLTYEPQIVIPYDIDSTGEGLVYGMGSGIVICADFSGKDVGAFILCLPIGIIGGGIYGLAAFDEEKKAKNEDRTLAEKLYDISSAHTALQQSILAYLNTNNIKAQVLSSASAPKSLEDDINYNAIDHHGASRILISGITKIEFSRLKSSSVRVTEPKICLIFEIESRLITAQANDTLSVHYLTECKLLSEWKKYDEGSFNELISNAFSKIAQYIVDEFILIYHPKYDDRNPSLKERQSTISYQIPDYVLAAITPEIDAVDFDNEGIEKNLRGNTIIPEADSLTPTIIWESFPFPWDMNISSNKFDNIYYEIKLYKAKKLRSGGGPLTITTEKLPYLNDITLEPFLKIKEPLLPCSVYYWSVRAKFNLNDSPRITEWGGVHSNPWIERRGNVRGFGEIYPTTEDDLHRREANKFARHYYYVFSTPAESEQGKCDLVNS